MVAGWSVGVSTERFVFGMWRRVNFSTRLQGIRMTSLAYRIRRVGTQWLVRVGIKRFVFGTRRRVNFSIRLQGIQMVS